MSMQEDIARSDTFNISTVIESLDLFSVFKKAVRAIIVVLIIKLLLVFAIIMGFYYVVVALINLQIPILINILGIFLSLSSITIVLLGTRPLLTLYIKKLRLFARLQKILSSIVVLLALSISILAIAISITAISIHTLEPTSLNILNISMTSARTMATNASDLAVVRNVMESLLSIPSLSMSILGILLALAGMFISDLLYLYTISLVAVLGSLLGTYRTMILICIYVITFIGMWCAPTTLLPIFIAIVCTWIVVSVFLALSFDELSMSVLKVRSSNAKGFA